MGRAASSMTESNGYRLKLSVNRPPSARLPRHAASANTTTSNPLSTSPPMRGRATAMTAERALRKTTATGRRRPPAVRRWGLCRHGSNLDELPLRTARRDTDRREHEATAPSRPGVPTACDPHRTRAGSNLWAGTVAPPPGRRRDPQRTARRPSSWYVRCGPRRVTSPPGISDIDLASRTTPDPGEPGVASPAFGAASRRSSDACHSQAE